MIFLSTAKLHTRCSVRKDVAGRLLNWMREKTGQRQTESGYFSVESHYR